MNAYMYTNLLQLSVLLSAQNGYWNALEIHSSPYGSTLSWLYNLESLSANQIVSQSNPLRMQNYRIKMFSSHIWEMGKK